MTAEAVALHIAFHAQIHLLGLLADHARHRTRDECLLDVGVEAIGVRLVGALPGAHKLWVLLYIERG